MKAIALIIRLILRTVGLVVVLAIIAGVLFVAYKGNQPMNIPQAPKGMTYFQFISNRLDAARIVKPARCGWVMFGSLAVLGPVYSIVYTEVGVHPNGWLAKGVASDADIPKGVQDSAWLEIPGIWWNVVERLSWTMLGKQNVGCKLGPVVLASSR
jgi:hypothetical protein